MRLPAPPATTTTTATTAITHQIECSLVKKEVASDIQLISIKKEVTTTTPKTEVVEEEDSKGHSPTSITSPQLPPPIIDTSTPEALERDFNAWLKGACFSQSPPPPPPPLQIIKGDLRMHHQRPSANRSNSLTDARPLPSIDNFLPDSYPTGAAATAGLRSVSNKRSFSESSPSSYNPSMIVHHHPMGWGVGVEAGGGSDGESPNSALSCSSGSPQGQGAVTLLLPAVENTFGSLLSLSEGDLNGGVGVDGVGATPTTNIRRINNRSSGTNQLGRTYSPGLPLSLSEREQIVGLFREGWKICDISKQLCITHSCVSKILHRFRSTGSVRPKDAKEGRQESPLVAAIRDYRQRLGMSRQSEIREQLILDGVCRRENVPSRSSINHILRTKLDLKRRKKQ